uniref:Uncharacterized protein n=1 Tax=Physcomitrium patens TaxID=3218 RepID=A0A2K1J426_PHYPA|nr:hypothetical protein PHYPA_022135 [Physcomitrium patens]
MVVEFSLALMCGFRVDQFLLLVNSDQAEEASAAGLLDINRCAATGRQARARWYP